MGYVKELLTSLAQEFRNSKSMICRCSSSSIPIILFTEQIAWYDCSFTRPDTSAKTKHVLQFLFSVKAWLIIVKKP